MQIKIFSIPVKTGEAFTDELNAFLRGHKILQVEQELVQGQKSSYWSFCIQYIEGKGYNKVEKKERKDYKKILSEEHFARFSKLRIIRKQISQEDGVPAFTVFVDTELADLAALKTLTIANMQSVKGIGEKKVEKYADRFIKALSNEESK